MVRMFCLAEPILQHRMDLNNCQTSDMPPSSLLSKTMKLLEYYARATGKAEAAVKEAKNMLKKIRPPYWSLGR